MEKFIKNILTLLACSGLLASCSTTILIPNSHEAYKDLDFQIAGKEATLEFVDGHKKKVTISTISKDLIYGFTEDSIEKMETTSINEITVKVQNPGYALFWGIVGGASSFLAGFFIGATVSEDLETGATIAIVSSIVGLVTGAAVANQSTSKYILQTDEMPILENSKFRQVKSYVRIELETGFIEEGKYIVFTYKDKEVKLLRNQIKLPDQKDKKIIIMIPKSVYLKHFE